MLWPIALVGKHFIHITVCGLHRQRPLSQTVVLLKHIAQQKDAIFVTAQIPIFLVLLRKINYRSLLKGKNCPLTCCCHSLFLERGYSWSQGLFYPSLTTNLNLFHRCPHTTTGDQAASLWLLVPSSFLQSLNCRWMHVCVGCSIGGVIIHIFVQVN